MKSRRVMPVLLFCLALAAGGIVFVGVVGLNKCWCRVGYAVFALAGRKDDAAYCYALSIEKEVMKCKTRAELEKILCRCSKSRPIQPAQSFWGKDFTLEKGEKMIQYLIKDEAPLDVVFDQQDQVKCIYTSYE